jgi:F-type H+-transporting ATPase subunit b
LEQLAPLGINLGYLASQIINFFVLFILLRFVLYKPLRNMMEKRRDRIAEGVNNAQRAEDALASAEADRQALLDEARAEAQRITSEARQRAEEAARRIEAEARDEAARIRQEADTEASQEKEAALAEMREQIVSLSMAAANHLVATGLDDKRQKELVAEFFTAVPPEAKALNGEMTVVTAVPLTATEQKNFQKKLGADGVTFTVDPRILGGVIVRAGGQQVDASYRSQLTDMRASLA